MSSVRAAPAVLRPADASSLSLPAGHAESIARSHERCLAWGLTRIEQRPPDPLGRAALEQLRARHRGLSRHASPVMEMLYGQIVDSESMVVLCDPGGVIVHSIGDDDFLARAAKVALQPGVNWSESHKGTNAIGTALVDERPTLVHGDEHYLLANDFLTCSAAPILDPHGQIAGVLDVTGDHRGYHRHTMALVKMSVRMIENRWLDADYPEAVRLHLHQREELLGTLTEAQLALAPDGRVLAANRGAVELLGLSGTALRHHDLRSLFGASLGPLMDHARLGDAVPLQLETVRGAPARLLHARLAGPPRRASVSVAGLGVKAPSLADLERQAMRRALDACSGNVSLAARQLGVSRSTIYRKLRRRRADA